MIFSGMLVTRFGRLLPFVAVLTCFPRGGQTRGNNLLSKVSRD
jgi:hypothetical protein